MGLGILISLLVFDFLWFGAFTVTIFNFMKVNIIDNIASTYGTHQFGWYTTQGLFVTCGLSYIFGVHGLYKCRSVHRLAKVYAAR